MNIIFYVLILVSLFFIAFFSGFVVNPKEKKQKQIKYNYFLEDEKDNNNYADFLHYDGSNKKGD